MDTVLTDSKEVDELYETQGARHHRLRVFYHLKSLLHRLYITWSTNEPKTIPATPDWPKPLRLLKVVGMILLAIQLVILCWWSDVLISRGSVTFDFSIFQQAIYLISHGNLNPFSTVHGYYFRQDHSAFIMWPLSFFYLIWPHTVTLAFIQDVAVVAIEVVAFRWLLDIAAQKSTARSLPPVIYFILTTGLVLLTLNPWTLWATSFDFHVEALSTLFVLLTARALYQDKKTAWGWLVLSLACGDLGSTYLLTIGLSAILTGKHWLKRGVVICVLALGWSLFLQATKGTLGDGLKFYANLTGTQHNTAGLIVKSIILHPTRVAKTLIHNRLNIWADISPEGFLGYLWPPTAIFSLAVLLESALNGYFVYVAPGFQNIALVSVVALGTIAILIWLATKKRGRILSFVLSLLICSNTIIWAVIWLPQVSSTWLLISPRQGQVLDKLAGMIPKQDEVIASNGFGGKFAARKYIRLIVGTPITEPIYRVPAVWFVIGPNVGIEPASVSGSRAFINEVSHLPNSHLVLDQAGIWAYKWYPPKSFIGKTLSVNTKINPETSGIPAWTNAGPAGTVVIDGPVNDWYVTSNGQQGYVIDQAYWQEEPGHYLAKVEMSVAFQADVEVWNAANSTLLARRIVPGTGGNKVTIDIPVDLSGLATQYQFTGWGLWKIAYTEPPGNPLEIRVWSPGGNNPISIYKISMIKT